MKPIKIATFYHFANCPDAAKLQMPWKTFMQEHAVTGTILVTPEGINATIAGPHAGVDAILTMIRQDPRFTPMPHKESFADANPFARTKVKLKRETIPLGVQVNPRNTGTYLNAQEWNKMIQREDVVVVDTRNDYEVQMGKFKNAQDPKTKTFRDLPAWVAAELTDKSVPVAMYCTGGIRCEKSTAYLKDLGFEHVYHLEGGILKYLEETPQENSLWEGDCYVFDDRVAVQHDLSPATKYQMCAACNRNQTNAASFRRHDGQQLCDTCAAQKGIAQVHNCGIEQA